MATSPQEMQEMEQKVSHDTAPLPPLLAYTCPEQPSSPDAITEALKKAYQEGDIETVKAILEQRHINVIRYNSPQYNAIKEALKKACQEGDVETVKALLEQHNINVNIDLGFKTKWFKLKVTHTSLLSEAVCANQIRLVRFLLREPSRAKWEDIQILFFTLDVNGGILNDQTAFENVNYDMALTLIREGGVDVNQKHRNNDDSRTLLIYAWLRKNQTMAQQLVAWGANICLNEQYYKNLIACEQRPWTRPSSYVTDEQLAEMNKSPEAQQQQREVFQQIALTKKAWREALWQGVAWANINNQHQGQFLDEFIPVVSFLFKQNSMGAQAFQLGFDQYNKVKSKQPLIMHVSQPTMTPTPAATKAPGKKKCQRNEQRDHKP